MYESSAALTVGWMDQVTALLYAPCLWVLYTLSCCQSTVPITAAGDAHAGRRLCANKLVLQRKREAVDSLRAGSQLGSLSVSIETEPHWRISITEGKSLCSVMDPLTPNTTGEIIENDLSSVNGLQFKLTFWNWLYWAESCARAGCRLRL